MNPDPAQTSLSAWATALAERGTSPSDLVGACARQIARGYGLDTLTGAPAILQHGRHLEVPAQVELTPWDLGRVYELALDDRHRHTHGVHYTPAAVAQRLVAVGLQNASPGSEVCDPAVGGGVFLLAVAEAMLSAGVDRRTIVRDRLWGVDIDPVAIEVAAASLALWGSQSGDSWVTPGEHLACGDTLVLGLDVFESRTDGFGLVVGNPPFQNQLGSSTARSGGAAQKLRSRWNVAAGPYADTAAFFLLAGLELADEDGTVLLVQPQSVLVAADSELIRRRLSTRAALVGLWLADRGVFDAEVRVCAPVLRVGATSGAVKRWVGARVEPVRDAPGVPASGTWSPLVADILGVPPVAPRSVGVLGDSCSATAGFRDQFYGLAAHTSETGDSQGPALPLITVGMIDPLRNRWGTIPFKYHGRRWTEPSIDFASLKASDPKLARWVAERRVPKLLVATQTKVIEVIVDDVGDMIPSTPVIAVVSDPGRLWHVAAVLTSPAVAASAFLRAAGAALSADTLRLSAKQVLTLPVPFDGESWDEGARLARVAANAANADDAEGWERALDQLGTAMGQAYELGDDAARVLDWWRARRPGWR